ncbi:serine/threonine protein kinase [Gordonia malaquae]|uniref:non-specific serine/threonine protein kinase n=1 Tax=Gordonia malaquae NBRC 108250 TaxID=1223542 RepID=M3VAA0_GORML|nr:protein kinase [Gordonia malaquae]GAC78648.1 serine/threonine protein kinase PknL [Gordonia malaquae NBRC 108250]SED57799.1 serine/threonine protein kinase [Gordonia malaquae]
MTAPADPLIGRVLERRYQIDAPIARGGMSSVYVGTDVRLHRRVAIKVMDARYVGDPQFLRRFEFEARAVAGLSHPGLVAVYDQSIDGDIAFLVMELVRGGSIRELLRERGPMPPHAVAAIGIPMLGGLGTAHRAGLVHRDVKPENVLISDTGDIKVADFGLVRAVAEAGVTSASVILGTAAYLSPEQVSSTDIDARSDVYSAGILMFELLTGRQPFSGSTQLALAYQRLSYDVPAPGDLIPGVPPQFDDIVLRATERRPDDRFADGFAMQHAILDAVDEIGLPPFTVPAPSQASARVTNAIARPVVPRPVAPPAVARPAVAGTRQATDPDRFDDDADYDDYADDDHWDDDYQDARYADDDWDHDEEPNDARSARRVHRGARPRQPDVDDDPLPPSRRMAAVVWFLLVTAIAAGIGTLGWALGSAVA